MAAYGVVAPAFCFLFAAANGGIQLGGGPWQSGDIRDYAEVLLLWPASGPLLPWAFLSAFCLTLWLLQPNWADLFVVRLGIYTGVIVSLQFLLLILIVTAYASPAFSLIVAPVSAAVVYGGVRLVRRWRRFSIRYLLILTTVVAILITISATTELETIQIFALMPLLTAGATPTLCLIAYVVAAKRVSRDSPRREPFPWPALFIWWVWLTAWLASWKFALDMMLVEYEKLPTAKPSCYVSAAAAGGHSSLVRYRNRRKDGLVVSRQMQRLKFFEFAVAAAAPSLHRWLRCLYNRMGPPLARWCGHNVWFADTTYLLLLPLESLAYFLQRATNTPDRMIERLYHRTDTSSPA